MRKLLARTWVIRLGLGLLGVLVISAGSYAGVQATWGRADYHGYFTNIVDNGGGSVLPVLRDGLAIPNDINTVGEFIALLKNSNNSSSPQKKTGSAFIVYTMLGRNGANRSRTISAADWNDLTARLQQRAAKGKIAWVGNVVNCQNSYWQGEGGSYDGGKITYDDAYYHKCKNQAGIRFYNDNGSIAYELLRLCANPMGDVAGLPNRPPDVPKPPVNKAPGGGSTEQCKPMRVNIIPGKDAKGNNVPVRVSTSVRTIGTYSTRASANITSDHTTGRVYTVNFKETRNWISNYKPIKDGTGWIYRWDPVYSAPRSWTRSIGPCYNFSLTPLVNLNGQTTIESGGSARVNNSVSNAGPTKAPGVNWRLTRMIFAPGTTLTAGQMSARTNGSDPCTTFTNAGRTACDIAQQNTNKTFPIGTSNFSPVYNYVAPVTMAAGTQICFTVGVSKPTEDPTPIWRHSALLCLVVSKKPKMQIHGGDVRVGGKIETGLSTVTNGGTTKTYGSWVEYGSLSVGPNTGFASGSGLNKGGAPSPANWNRLTFANIDNNGVASYGNFALSPRAAALISQFTIGTPKGPPSADLGSLTSGTYSAGNLTINGSSVGQEASGKGKTIIVVASGTVTINGNISYSAPGGSFTNINQIPQVVIVANAINITGAVTDIDAWLISTGAATGINTCSDVALTASLTSNVCSQKLTVNGPVATSHLYLRRTAGADDGTRSGDPAEVFNLRADAYLWGRTYSTDAGKATTVYTTELPPRF